MMLLFLFFIFHIVHGQLSVDELFSFHSKYTSTGDCKNFQYEFSPLQIQNKNYNQLIFDCNSSSLILRNTAYNRSSICPEDENDLENFRIRFHQFFQTLIEVNQFLLHGIELCSLDDLIQSNYIEVSYYRSTSAVLINLKNENDRKQHHLAIATNGQMTFLIFLLSSESNQIDIIFPNENIFQFNRSAMNIWRIDQGYVLYPKSLEKPLPIQLSKTKFSLFNNETFFIYYTPESIYRRLIVHVDKTPATCVFDDILRCQFPILPLTINDTHQPIIQLFEGITSVFNSTVSLIPRLRLNSVPTNNNLTDLENYVINIDENLCNNNSLKSLYIFTAHLQTEDINGTRQFLPLTKTALRLIGCNITVEFRREIINLIKSVKMTDIVSLNVDLKHQWDGHENCRAERTRINFIK